MKIFIKDKDGNVVDAIDNSVEEVTESPINEQEIWEAETELGIEIYI